MYRVHAPPSEEKLQRCASSCNARHQPAARQPVHPRDLDGVLRRVAGTPEAPLVNEVMLRSQSQAAYSPDNIGHFGLALPRYAHFTSPIRRYADLLVHRALITGLRLGAGGLAPEEAARFADRPPSRSPPPSAARSLPSARRSTVTLLHSWRTRPARISPREFPA